jgi:transposase
LIAVVGPLLKARQAIEQQTDDLDSEAVPGVGPITALYFKAMIDDPTRFKRSRSVGAYVRLRTRRHASCKIFRSGWRAADPRTEMVGAKGLGHEARQAKWGPKSHSRRRAQARARFFAAPPGEGGRLSLLLR